MDICWTVVVCVLFLAACITDAHGKCGDEELPAVNFCEDNGGASLLANKPIYLDSSSGAPAYDRVECTCNITFSYSTTVYLTYRIAKPIPSSCDIEFSAPGITFGCQQNFTNSTVRPASFNITFTKKTAIRHWYSCLEIRSLTDFAKVKCFPLRQYYAPDEVVNGMFSAWSKWSSCSATCGTASQTRKRLCNEPSPRNGGESCLTGNGTRAMEEIETRDCSLASCPETQFTSAPTDMPTSAPTDTPTSSPTGTTSPSTGGSGGTPETESSADKDDPSNTGAIIGGVIGGLVFLLLLVLLIICLVTRRRRKKEKEKVKPSSGPRSVRYISHGDDVTVTENELYRYDGETPSHATNALFVGGIPETPDSPGHIPHFSTDTGDRYAVIMDSNRTKPMSKERPKLDTSDSQDVDKESNGHVRASTDTVKLAENYIDDHNIGQGVENPAYDENYLAPYDSADGVTKPKTSSASSTSPYDYIDHEKLKKDDEAFENENLAGDYATLPDDTPNAAEENDRYKRFISSDAEKSPDDGYLKSPKRGKSFEFPDTN